MNQKAGGARTAGIVIAAALFVLVVLIVAFVITSRGGRRDAISLPESAVQQEPSESLIPPDELFVSVDNGNVQKILEVLEKPEAYHQSVSLSTSSSGGSADKTAELWCSGQLMRATIREQNRVRHILTNGSAVWLWYDGDVQPKMVQQDAGITFEDLVGFPTYEMLAVLPKDTIQEAGFVTLDDLDGTSCLYLSVDAGEGYRDRYWVDVQTQLLCKADSTYKDTQVYLFRQTALDRLTAEDAALRDAFRLPDGTEITAE